MAHVATVFKSPVTWGSVVGSLGLAGTLNVLGRAVFVEGAKALAWGTASWWAEIGLSLLGATTAGVQTYVIGLLAIAIARNGGQAISVQAAAEIVSQAKQNYDVFVNEMKSKKLSDPGAPPKSALDEVEGGP